MATSPHAAYDSNRNRRSIHEASANEKKERSGSQGDFLLNTAEGGSDNVGGSYN